MTSREQHIPQGESQRDPLGVRVARDVQEQFGEFVNENYENRKGTYGYCVEQAMIEYMDNDRYNRIDQRVRELEETVKHTNALVRRLVTAEKEKGVFLEGAPKDNMAGSRKEREEAVVREWVDGYLSGELPRSLSEDKLNGLIGRVADVTSGPSKRDYRETFIERGLVEVDYAEYVLTEYAFEMCGVAKEQYE